MKKLTALSVAILALFLTSAATFNRQNGNNQKLFERALRERAWVDSIFHSMSEDERLGQLIWLRAHVDKDAEYEAMVENLIKKYHAGGICFFNPTHKGTAEKQVELTNRYQAAAGKVPLFVSIDGEWGLGMRLRETAMSFPRQLLLGAVKNDQLIYRMGAEIARHCKRIGVNVNFAPVADVNNNPNNPVIGFRSFGEDKYRVAAKAWQYMKGLQDNGVLASAKHFPGHGDTDVDSHYDLPVVNHTRQRLDSIELFPFKILIEEGVGSVMVAHLQVPALDPTPNLPTTLSYPTVTGLLRNELNFNGLILTDGLEMKGVTKHHAPGEVEALALAAGVDGLLLPGDVDAAVKTIKAWLKASAAANDPDVPNPAAQTAGKKGRLDLNQLHESVKKVLRWKYRLGVTKFENIAVEGIREDVNDNQARAVKRLLIENALTLVRNEGNMLPFGGQGFTKLTSELPCLAIGAKDENAFHQSLSRFARLDAYVTDKEISAADSKKWLQKFKSKTVVVSLHGMSQFPGKNFGLTASTIEFVEKLRQQAQVVLVVFGNPYSLKYFDNFGCILEAYEDDDEVQNLAAQALFGAFPLQGTLPVTASAKSKLGTGIVTKSVQRMAYGVPEEVGMSSKKLSKIDGFVKAMIDTGAMPGCVVLVARDGKVVFEKAYGRHTYDPNSPQTQVSDIWDLASITKIAATTLSLMKLQEAGKFSVQAPVEKYLPEFASTNKAGIPLVEMLTHRARLTPWIKFYEKTTEPPGKPSPRYYDAKPSGRFNLPVAEDLWLRADYPDSIWQAIRDSPLEPSKEYKYSDLGFYIAGEIVRRLSGQRLEDYVQEQFYQPLGLATTTFRPLEKFPAGRIPPTEEDSYFRGRRVQGYVHDMGAAMLNQASGHAGLFSNASDLATLMQMLLNKGWYGGRQYLQPETIHFYTSRCGDCTRRGIGFDMPQRDRRFEHNLSALASEETFGHLGFTGTAAWADPAQRLVFVFLSNRTYPAMSNNKFGKLNVRGRVQDLVYEAIVEE